MEALQILHVFHFSSHFGLSRCGHCTYEGTHAIRLLGREDRLEPYLMLPICCQFCSRDALLRPRRGLLRDNELFLLCELELLSGC